MRMRLLVSLLMGAGIAAAQFGASGRTSTVRHSNDYSDQRRNGRCVIRVLVDQEADIELRWDKIRVQTIRGRAGRDNGSECNAPLPQAGISNFQFQGMEGRGQVSLREQPNANNGWAAIVRIADPDGGEGAYTYEVSWNWNGRGGGGQSGNSEQQTSNYDPASVCRSALRQRLRQDNQGQLIGWANPAPRTRQDGYRSMYEGTANVQTQNGNQQMRFTCAVNPDNQTVESLDYQLAGGGGQFFPESNANAGGRRGRSNNILSLCQEQLRARFQQDFNSSDVQFYTTPDRWMDGRTERITGNGHMSRNGRRINFGYSCAGDPASNNLDWSDYETARRSGNDPR